MNLVDLPKQDASKLRKCLDAIKRQLPDQLEMLAVLARIDHAKYQAYVTAGFSKDQAFELMKAEKIKARV